jgi:hypothetical protein
MVKIPPKSSTMELPINIVDEHTDKFEITFSTFCFEKSYFSLKKKF